VVREAIFAPADAGTPPTRDGATRQTRTNYPSPTLRCAKDGAHAEGRGWVDDPAYDPKGMVREGILAPAVRWFSWVRPPHSPCRRATRTNVRHACRCSYCQAGDVYAGRPLTYIRPGPVGNPCRIRAVSRTPAPAQRYKVPEPGHPYNFSGARCEEGTERSGRGGPNGTVRERILAPAGFSHQRSSDQRREVPTVWCEKGFSHQRDSRTRIESAAVGNRCHTNWTSCTVQEHWHTAYGSRLRTYSTAWLSSSIVFRGNVCPTPG
jgi:hypothetical protein